jgi:ABC-type transport system involved in multi-copper enzyme maturation permease subunit
MTTQSARIVPSDTLTLKRALTLARPNPLLSVLRWEVRRMLASRITWVLATIVFGICAVLLLLSRQAEDFGQFDYSNTGRLIHGVTGTIPWTTPFGTAILLPFPALLFGLFLPFVVSDGVARDLRRRTHELLMTTAVPTWAYVWGRYLAGAIVSFGLALVFLAAIVVVATVQHLAHPADYPLHRLPATLVGWALIVLAATVLVSGLSFALGTLLPRRANLIKAAVVLCWFVCGEYLPAAMLQHASQTPGFAEMHIPAWYTAYLTWDPTFRATGEGLVLGQFHQLIDPILRNPTLSDQAVLLQVRLMEQKMPNLGVFVWTHLAWLAAGLALVAVAAASFRRFRGVRG